MLMIYKIKGVVMQRILLLLVLLLTVFNGFSKEIIVEIYKKKFTPAQITIEQGDTVIWKNIEKRQYHNVWFKQLIKEEPDYLFPGESYQMTFNDKGEFPYLCGPHPKMIGTVIVN